MRVFISQLDSTLGQELAKLFHNEQHQVVGSVAQKSLVASVKHRLQEHPASDQPNALKDPVVFAKDQTALQNLLAKCDAVIYNVWDDPNVALEALGWLQNKLQAASAADADADADAAGGNDSEAKEQDEEDASQEEPNPTSVRFVAVSNLLTWARSPPLAKDSAGYKEKEYKQRKPARRFIDFKRCETQVLSANSDSLQTFVVASGLLYGGAQSDFRYLLREAWMNPAQDLIVPSLNDKKGDHILPMMSVYDLAQVVFKVTLADRDTMKRNYLIATDDARHTLRHVCQAISVHLGNGRLQDLSSAQVEELLVDEDAQSLTSLQMNAWFDKENRAMDALGIDNLQFRDGFVKHAGKIIAEYIKSMDLRPLCMVVTGPPRVGKTHLAKELAKKYCLPLVTIDAALQELYQHHGLPDQTADQAAAGASSSSASASSTPSPSASVVPAPIASLQQTLIESKETPFWEWPTEHVVELLKWKLTSAACRNQGYVMDGVPFALNQAELLFAKAAPKPGGDGEENDNEEGQDGATDAATSDGNGNGGGTDPNPTVASESASGETTTGASESANGVPWEVSIPCPAAVVPPPNRVIALTSTPQLLEKRAMAMPAQEAAQTGNSHETFGLRMKLFSDNEDPMNTFFEKTHDLEILELSLEREQDFNQDKLWWPVQQYVEQGRKPFNFHPTRQELAAQADLAARKRAQEMLEKELADLQEAKDNAESQARLAAEKTRLEANRGDEEQQDTPVTPLRAYLMDSVVPVLTEGMLEVGKMHPDDPIDYLAEFLSKKSQRKRK